MEPSARIEYNQANYTAVAALKSYTEQIYRARAVVAEWARRFAVPVLGPKITLEQLSLFCGNLATCISAGLDVSRSLKTCQRSSPSPVLREILTAPARETESGATLFDALRPHEHCFPAFFLPAVRCGEESGRLDETLKYLEGHCRLLAGPARTMRNMWLVPLCLMLADTVICSVAYFIMAPRAMANQYVADWLKFYAMTAIVVGAVSCVPPLRLLAENLRLILPVLGPAERELAVNRFFHVMSLLYSTGGRRVEVMIRLAADSAGNSTLRADFLRAAAVIESAGTMGEAFSAISGLSLSYKATIVAGEEAGRLEDAFDSVSRESGEAVVSLLAAVQPLYFRIVALMVIGSIMGTLLSLSTFRH
jgi:type II secretory pathway component PulF